MSWTTGRLNDLVEFQRGYDITKASQKPGNVPVVSSSGINSFHSEAKVAGPGVVIGRKGTLGSAFYMHEDYWPHDTTLWSRNLKGNSALFVYYFVQTLHLENYNVGNANPTLNRNHIHDLEIRFPDPATQEWLANRLRVYDDLIENNRRRIQLLEQAARMLYREWFVRFRFPGHEHVTLVNGVPGSWETWTFDEYAAVTFGYAFKSNLFNEDGVGRPAVRIRDILAGESATFTPEDAPVDRAVEDGDLLIGMDGEYYIGFWAGGTAWLVQRVCRIRGQNGASAGYLRYALEQPIRNFNESNVGSTVSHLSAKDLRSIRLPKPPHAILDAASESLDHFRCQMVNLKRQCCLLSRTRNLLLPRLMCGEISV